MTLDLPGLKGTNPLGLFAALGVIDVLTRSEPNASSLPRLWWSDDLEPEARIEGVDTIDELVDLIDTDRRSWAGSRVLTPIVDGVEYSDVKLSTTRRPGRPSPLRAWMEDVHAHGSDADIALLHALVAEGATMGTSDDAKPSHLHFTAGQQKFLEMIRKLRDNVTPDHVQEALIGPWRFDSPLPMMGWDTSRGDRIYALRGFDPAGEKKLGVPGAEWLGVLGLRFFPVATRVVRGRAQLVTTGCTPEWKKGSFSWPLWGQGNGVGPAGLTAPVIEALLADASIARMNHHDRATLGVSRYLRAPITRSDQGGYGSFGPPEEVVTNNDRITAMVM